MGNANSTPHQARPSFPFCPEKVQREDHDDGDHRAKEFLRAADKGVKGEDIDDNRAEDEKAEVSRARNGDEDSAQQFENFHEGEIACWPKRPKEHGDRRSWRWWRCLDEIEQHDHGRHDEEETEDNPSDGGCVFHRNRSAGKLFSGFLDQAMTNPPGVILC